MLSALIRQHFPSHLTLPHSIVPLMEPDVFHEYADSITPQVVKLADKRHGVEKPAARGGGDVGGTALHAL